MTVADFSTLLDVAETTVGKDRELVQRLFEKVWVAHTRFVAVEKERDEQNRIIRNNPKVVMLKKRLREADKGLF